MGKMNHYKSDLKNYFDNEAFICKKFFTIAILNQVNNLISLCTEKNIIFTKRIFVELKKIQHKKR